MVVNTASFTRSEHTQREVVVEGTLGNPIRCDVYEPSTDSSTGTVVVCPGYGSVKELMAPWARSLACRGYRSVVPAYSGYGAGDEVERIFPSEHVDDVRSVVRWVKDQERKEVGPLLVVGVSYGGAVALAVGAHESGIDGVVSIVGYGSGLRHLRHLRTDQGWQQLLQDISRDRTRRAGSGKSQQITLDAILQRDEKSRMWRERVEAQYPHMRFDVTLESVDHLIEFNPDSYLPFSGATPLLIIHAENDRVVPVGEAHHVYNAAHHPKRLVILKDTDHHQVHEPAMMSRCLDEIDRFFEDPTSSIGKRTTETTEENAVDRTVVSVKKETNQRRTI